MMDCNHDCINYELHSHGKLLLNTRGIPESHYWWPKFCRKNKRKLQTLLFFLSLLIYFLQRNDVVILYKQIKIDVSK